MENSNNIMITLGLSALLGTITVMILVADRLQQLKKRVNPRLLSLGYYWEWFRIYEVPAAEPARSQFLLSMGANSPGTFSSIAVVGGRTGGIALATIGLFIAIRWAFYSREKKRALAALADPNELAAATIAELVAKLR